jgi:hypothetical protein
LPYPEIAAFAKTLRGNTSTAARALEFAILTTTRTNETIGATWAEMDLSEGVKRVVAAARDGRARREIPKNIANMLTFAR